MATGSVSDEVIGAELPAEPPLWSAVVDAHGRLYQRVHWWVGPFMSYQGWVGVGERRQAARPTWMELLNRGPVTVVWRADEPPAEQP